MLSYVNLFDGVFLIPFFRFYSRLLLADKQLSFPNFLQILLPF